MQARHGAVLCPDFPQQKLVRESLAKQRESTQLVEQAKARVEQLIEEAIEQ